MNLVSNRTLTVIVCTIAFLPFLILDSPYDRLLLSAFFGALTAALLVPLFRRWTMEATSRFFQTLIISILIITLISGFWISVATVRASESTPKLVGAFFILFSTGLYTGFAYRLSILSSPNLSKPHDRSLTPPEIGLNHWAVEFSVLNWLEHGSYALGSLGLVGLYLLGWYLVGGFPLTLYSLLLQLFILVVLRSLAINYLGPQPLEFIRYTQPTHTPTTVKALFHPSRESLIVLAALVPLAIFTNLVDNPFSIGYFPVFLVLILAYLLSLVVYIWRLGDQKK